RYSIRNAWQADFLNPDTVRFVAPFVPTSDAGSKKEEVVGHEKPSREEEFIVDGRGALEDFLETEQRKLLLPVRERVRRLNAKHLSDLCTAQK
ncbi:unnamed protein product, partial [Scytosiphon promiscuus]